MENVTERGMGHLLGLIGGALLTVGGVVAAAIGVADLILGRTAGAMGAFSETAVLVVLGGLVLLFAYMGEHEWKDKPVVSGVLLVLLALISWGVTDLGANALALVGGILAIVAGALYLIEPGQKAFREVASTA